MSTGAWLRPRTRVALLVALMAASCSNRSDEHKNMEYLIGGGRVRLVDGVAQTPAAPGSAASIVTRYFGNEVRGDLNGDGREDVVFLLTQETGGSGTFYYAVAALDTERGLVGSQAVLLGDRIAPQTTSLQSDGVIVVNYADRAPGDSLTTPPSVGKTLWLKLDPATLQLGEWVRDFEGEADPAVMTLDMKTWVWIRAVDNAGVEVVPGRAEAFTLTFGAEGRFSATTDCNRVNGGYESDGRALAFRGMAMTRMFCADSQESVFTGLLERTAGYSFTSRGELVLQLASDGGSMTFR
jgi:heat shock protein HslJ